jgi:hypothetical protein
MRRSIRPAALLCAIGAMAGAVLHLRRHAFEQHLATQTYEDIYYLPSAAALPVISLGYQQALADLIWCKSLVYFGEELQHQSAVRHAFEYTDAILSLDPDFRAAYRWIAVASLYRPVAVSMDAGLRAAEYLARAIDRWPRDGELHWDYGSLLRFELAPLEKDPAKKEKLIARAMPHLEQAARLGAGPPWLALTNAAMLNKLGKADHAIRSLEEIYPTVTDPNVKQQIELRIAQLRKQTFAEAMHAYAQQFEVERQKTYPYLSPGLFLLVGAPRPAPPASLAQSYFDASSPSEDPDDAI